MIVRPLEILACINTFVYSHGSCSTKEQAQSDKEVFKSSPCLSLKLRPRLSITLVKFRAIKAISMKEIVILMTLNVNWEGIKPIDESLVTELLLPLCPLII